jgi:Bacterial regulatory proteins, luxR family
VLSPREREVLALMAEGRSNAGIGRRLWVTEGTVEKHVRKHPGQAEPAGDRRRPPPGAGRDHVSGGPVASSRWVAPAERAALDRNRMAGLSAIRSR